MKIEKIEKSIIKSGATITEYNFVGIKGLIIEQNGLHIGIAKDLEQRERKAVLAHELGHIKKGGLYQIGTPPLLRQKSECIASRYAQEVLASPEEIRSAIAQGIKSSWELADYFEIPYDVMDKILTAYRSRMVI